MTVTIPTVDDFADTTVMRVIRKIVDYIRTDLVPSINDNDIERVDCTLSGQTITFRLYKGDNTRITDTVSLSTFVTSSELARELADYATESALADLQEQVTAISPQLSIQGNTLTVTVNGDSSSVTLPTGDANPYPTSVDLSVSGNNLSINIPMSEGNALKDTVALPQSGGEPSEYIKDVDYNISFSGANLNTKVLFTDKNNEQSSFNIVALSSEPNVLLFSGGPEENPSSNAIYTLVKNITTRIEDNKFLININGLDSNDFDISQFNTSKKLVTSGDITQFISRSGDNTVINKDFDIEIIDNASGKVLVRRISISKMTLISSKAVTIGDNPDQTEGQFYILIQTNGTILIHAPSNYVDNSDIIYTESINVTPTFDRAYRLFA